MADKIKPQAIKGPEAWSATASKYTDTVGRCTRIAAKRLVEMTDRRLSLSSPGTNVIDLAAGTGSQSLTLIERFPHTSVLATDITDSMLAELRTAYQRDQYCSTAQLTTQILDMQSPCAGNPELKGRFTHCLNGFAIQSVLDPQGTVRGMRELLRPGIGAVAAVVIWEFSRHCDPHSIWEEAVGRVNPRFKPLPRNITNDINSVEDLEKKMEEGGFTDLEMEVVRCSWDNEDFMEWFWEAKNPFALERMSAWLGDLQPVRDAMEQIVHERISSQKGIWVDTGIVLGTRP